MPKARKDQEASSVYDYYAKVLGVNPPHRDNGTEGLREYKLGSYCGRECRKIIDQVKELLDMCDNHPHIVDNIRKGVAAALEVICFG